MKSCLPSRKSWQLAPLQHWFLSSPSLEDQDPRNLSTLRKTLKSLGPYSLSCSTTLKGIQLGKIEGPAGWCVPVTEVDIKKYSTTEHCNGVNGFEQGNVDKLS